MARLPKDFLATGFRGNREKKSVAPHYLSEPFTSALAPLCGPLDFFCHIIWRQREGSTKRAKRGKKARHVMWQNLLRHCAVLTKVSEEFAPHYLAGIRHD